MVSFSRMSDQWGPGIRTGKADVVWDVAKAAPEVFDAVTKHSPILADDCTIVVLRYVGPGETD